MTFGDRLYYARRKKKISQTEMGKMVGVCRQAISKYENNESAPTWHIIVKIAEILEISLDYLAWGDKNEV